MELWKKLYNTVWLAFFCCVLIPRWMGTYVGFPVHGLLGILMLIVTQTNTGRLKTLPVPDRLKRISKAMAALSIFQIVTGMALGGIAHLAPNLSLVSTLLRGIHLVCALAVLSQASSLATGYDMWEEKEFGPATTDAKPEK